MPTCCVPGCRSGYSSSPKVPNVTFHKFPADKDRRDLWIRRIHRDFIPGEAHRVCSRHFRESDFKTTSADTNQRRKRTNDQLSRRVLKTTAFPSVFEDLPSYLTVEPAKEPSCSLATSSARLEAENARIIQQVSDFEESDVIKCIDEIENYVISHAGAVKYFTVKKDSLLYVLSYDYEPSLISVDTCIVIQPSLDFSVRKGGIPVDPLSFSCMQFSKKIIRFSDLANLLSYMCNYTREYPDVSYICDQVDKYIENNSRLTDVHCSKYAFLNEQLALVEKPVNRRRYSTVTFVKSLMWQSYSTACYKNLLDSECLTLPAINTLRTLTTGFQHSNASIRTYLTCRRRSLNEMKSNVTLIFDEIYVYQRPDYQNGRFLGLTTASNKPATTVLVFFDQVSVLFIQ